MLVLHPSIPRASKEAYTQFLKALERRTALSLSDSVVDASVTVFTLVIAQSLENCYHSNNPKRICLNLRL